MAAFGYDINEPAPDVDEAFATEVARQLAGDPTLDIELISASTWTVYNMYATNMQKKRVCIMGDAAHRHPPSNGLGSNTSIQDGCNLAWKFAAVLNGQAGEALLESYSQERVPIAKQIVTRANKSIGAFGPIFEALGMTGDVDTSKIRANMDARCNGSADAEAQRNALREAIAVKEYKFDAHGVEMNHRYVSDAIAADGQPEPPFDRDPKLHYQPTIWPGARLPHVWLFDENGKCYSTLDVCGKGRFTVLTGIGGELWQEAVEVVNAALGVSIDVRVIGPRRDWLDHSGDWARINEIDDSGAILVRPDHHVAWRLTKIPGDPAQDLLRVMKSVLCC